MRRELLYVKTASNTLNRCLGQEQEQANIEAVIMNKE